MAQLEAVYGVVCTCSEGLAGGAYGVYSPTASERAYELLDEENALRYDLARYGDEDLIAAVGRRVLGTAEHAFGRLLHPAAEAAPPAASDAAAVATPLTHTPLLARRGVCVGPVSLRSVVRAVRRQGDGPRHSASVWGDGGSVDCSAQQHAEVARQVARGRRQRGGQHGILRGSGPAPQPQQQHQQQHLEQRPPVLVRPRQLQPQQTQHAPEQQAVAAPAAVAAQGVLSATSGLTAGQQSYRDSLVRIGQQAARTQHRDYRKEYAVQAGRRLQGSSSEELSSSQDSQDSAFGGSAVDAAAPREPTGRGHPLACWAGHGGDCELSREGWAALRAEACAPCQAAREPPTSPAPSPTTPDRPRPAPTTGRRPRGLRPPHDARSAATRGTSCTAPPTRSSGAAASGSACATASSTPSAARSPTRRNATSGTSRSRGEAGRGATQGTAARPSGVACAHRGGGGR